MKVPDDKLVVIHGLKDYVVVQTEQILLVCRLEDEQRIKQFVSDIKTEMGDAMI